MVFWYRGYKERPAKYLSSANRSSFQNLNNFGDTPTEETAQQNQLCISFAEGQRAEDECLTFNSQFGAKLINALITFSLVPSGSSCCVLWPASLTRKQRKTVLPKPWVEVLFCINTATVTTFIVGRSSSITQRGGGSKLGKKSHQIYTLTFKWQGMGPDRTGEGLRRDGKRGAAQN